MVVDTFDIHEDMAKKLTDLMAQQAVNDRILAAVADQPTKYDTLLKQQASIQRSIDEIKFYITENCVPDKYRSDKYQWNYNGYDIAGTKVEILTVQ